ncbi:MAG TPA: putative lipid II flippase FtsW [Myxococcota bacterium]|nr:putative lipid II flippase FtsW [Myxococcota bacterium]
MLNRFGTSQLAVAGLLLVGFGLVMVYSASAARSEVVFGTTLAYLGRQSLALALGLCLGAACFLVPFAFLEKLGLLAWGASVLALAATFTPLGTSGGGAQRWLALGPLAFQPLEPAKLGVLFGLAQWLASHQDRMHDYRTSVLVPGVLAGIPVLLLLRQPDFGGAMLIAAFTAVLIFAAGARLGHLLVTGALVLPLAAAAMLLRDYRVHRLLAFVDPWADPRGHGYQLVQSQLAFGAGGLLGVGFGAGQQKLFFLPEAHNDFILSVVGEEVGLVGVGLVLIGFAVIALSSLGIAQRAKTPFATLVTLGAGLTLWLQAMLNAGVAMGLLPTKGSTLPLVSYGGTSLIASLASLGLIANAARPSKRGRAGWR